MVSKAFLPSLSLSSSARIINVSSDFASIAGEFVLPCTIFAAVVQPHQLGCLATAAALSASTCRSGTANMEKKILEGTHPIGYPKLALTN